MLYGKTRGKQAEGSRDEAARPVDDSAFFA